MTATEIRIARRTVAYMLESAEQGCNIEFFKGLGMALAVVYEETTGYSAMKRKPQEIMQWAKDLPNVPYPKVVSRD